MTPQEFNNQYNPDKKMIVTYKHHVTGEVKKGLLLGGIERGVAGNEYVNIDNFYNREFMDGIISLKDTGEKWLTKDKE